MPTETPKTPEPAPESKTAPRDLRAELEANLESAFTINLKAAETLPDAVSASLVALLTTSGPTSADVVAAIALDDPIEPEMSSE